MADCSIFIDETGGQSGHSRYYAITLVFHDQSIDLTGTIAKYEAALKVRNLADIPFHGSPCMNGHDEYENLSLESRKSMFVAFFVLLQHLPIRYRTFLYKRKELPSEQAFVTRMRKDIIMCLYDELEYFQSFDSVKIYYDGAQAIVRQSVRGAVEYALSKSGTVFRTASPAEYRLAQAADMICTLELTAQKYRAHETTRTDEKFFGNAGAFKNNYMKSLKRKRL
ncbi:MAG: DUF3800 domain-containing protein [Eggerthellaceae bacterium]|nr:DUF3800 domain-containing protein [Eggerthellaceae bacterium]